ncbi:hypothetical protein ACKFKF_18320 [Phormidesmis sp. 146-12]
MNDMPLLNLFTQLRDAGVPLGLEDYEAVLRAIRAGYGIVDQGALARLCQTLWIRSEDDQRLFDYYFELLTVPPNQPPLLTPVVPVQPIPPQRFPWKYLAIVLLSGAIAIGGGFAASQVWRKFPVSVSTNQPTSSPSPGSSPQLSETANQPFRRLETTEVLVVITGATASAGLVLLSIWLLQYLTDRWVHEGRSRPWFATKTPELALASETVQGSSHGVSREQIVLRAQIGKSQIKRHQTPVPDELFPLTQRQMKQSWRYLRCLVQEGTVTEVDVPATVDQIGRQGIFLKPVLVPRRKNRTQLLILLDQGSSMTPFQALSTRLVETARRGGRLGEVSVFHFRNCPTDSLYCDSAQRVLEPLDAVLGRLSSRQVVILIVSDAGAARGRFNLQRIDQTEEFLTQLKQRVRYMAWLNPMPYQRWVGTTAAEIAYLVPMFEMNRQGLNRAIAVLRGQPIASEARR